MIQDKENKELLCRLMEIGELDYENMLMDYAYDYLDKREEVDAFGRKVLTHSRYFWAWWANQWNRRNRLFIVQLDLDKVYHILQPELLRKLRQQYRDQHSVEMMKVHPSRVVMEQSYAEMIGEVIDGELKQKQHG